MKPAVLFLFLLPLACPFLTSCADDSFTAPPTTFDERLQRALEDGFSKVHGKGFSAAVLVPGEPMWTGTVGTSHGNIAVNTGSVFAAGSITKTFTAITILRLAEEGRLSLDDSLHAWFPPYPHVDPDITVRQLMSHTSGLSDFTDPPGWFSDLYAVPEQIWDMEAYFLKTIRPPYFEKGAGWSYSTSGYILLRMLIERASERTVAEAYHDYVLGPATLQNTYVCPSDPLPPTLAHGWMDLTGDGSYDDLSALPLMAFCSAAGGQVFTTPSDLARLGAALMRDRTILSDSSYAEMTDFYFPVAHDEPMVHGYGLGLMWFDASFVYGHTVWGHGGNAPGYAAGMLYLPESGAIVAVMDNTEHGEAMEILQGIFQVVDDTTNSL